MDCFPIVLAICREALPQASSTMRRHVLKLQDELAQQGHTDQAAALNRLLNPSKLAAKLVPSQVILNEASAPERLSHTVRPPVDRESAVPLANINFPDTLDRTHFPILTERLEAIVQATLEEWRMQHELHAVGLKPPAALLLLGPPGTGKTELARRMAYEFGLPLVTARLDGLISSFLGTTARNIAMLFEFANRYQCVLLLDEFDALAKIRDDPHEIGEIKRVVNSLLQCLDARRPKGFTIAVTNHNHLLDPAIWRRFDVTIEVPVPGREQRRSIVERYMGGVELHETEAEFLTWLTDGFSGSEIETLCDAIKRHVVLRRDTQPTIFHAAKLTTPARGTAPGWRRAVFLDDHPEQLVRELIKDSEYRFTQKGVATLLGTNQSTISRWVHAGALSNAE